MARRKNLPQKVVDYHKLDEKQMALYDQISAELEKTGFCAKRIRFVHNNEASQASIVMMEAMLGKGEPKIEMPLILRDENGYTKEYRDIYGTW